MAPDDTSGARPGPVVLRIKLRYDDVEVMVQRFAPNVGKSGLFLPTKAIQPIGTQVKFELRISDDTPVLVGLGKVVAVREPDPANPRAASGMSIELMRVSREGGDMIKRMIAQRRALGLPSVAIPMPEDIDAARRDVETAPSGVVRDVVPAMASAPVAEQVFTARPTESGPIGVARNFESSPVSAGIAALAPEPTKPKRPRVADLIARATELSGPMAALTVPGLDDNNVDVGRAIARARALAGGDVDAELASLREESAAPIEIGIEAASAELARQLGGAAVIRKERSGVARWAPPPAVEISTRTPLPASETRSETASDRASEAASETRASETETAPSSQHEIIAPDGASTSVDAEEPVPYAAADVELTTDPSVDPVTPVTPVGTLMIDDNVDVGRFETALEGQRDSDSGEEHLDSIDMEPLDEEEHTLIGALPVDPDAFAGSSYSSVPSAPADLADKLDAQLADAEAEVDKDFAALSRTAFGEESALAAEEDPAIEFGAQRTKFGTDSPLLYTQVSQQASYAEPVPVQPASDEEFEIEEIDDFDVLAEADADDADLLLADGERDASGSHEVVPEEKPREGSYDFAANLDLGDDAPDPAEFDNERRGGFVASFADEDRDVGAIPGHDPFDPPSGGYTLAEDHHPAALFEIRSQQYGRQRDDRDGPVPREPVARPPEPSVLGAPPDEDLESALEQLDPDLDELSIPREGRPPGAPGSGRVADPAPAAKSNRMPRAATDDGIIIDFDDDEAE